MVGMGMVGQGEQEGTEEAGALEAKSCIPC